MKNIVETRYSCNKGTVVTCLILSPCLMLANAMKLAYSNIVSDGISMLSSKFQLVSQSLSNVVDRRRSVGQMFNFVTRFSLHSSCVLTGTQTTGGCDQ